MSESPVDVAKRDASRVDVVAWVAHEANRAYCQAVGDQVPAVWSACTGEERQSKRAGVRDAADGATPMGQHEAWCAAKRAAGWVFGDVKDEQARTHPCLVGYDELPELQQSKDRLFLGVVKAFL